MLAAAARVPRAQFARFFSSVATIKNVINGDFVESKTTKWVDIHNPGATQLCTKSNLNSAISHNFCSNQRAHCPRPVHYAI